MTDRFADFQPSLSGPASTGFSVVPNDAADLPEAERPVVQVLDARSATFGSLVEAARRARGADFSACDIQLPVQVSGAPAPSA